MASRDSSELFLEMPRERPSVLDLDDPDPDLLGLLRDVDPPKREVDIVVATVAIRIVIQLNVSQGTSIYTNDFG